MRVVKLLLPILFCLFLLNQANVDAVAKQNIHSVRVSRGHFNPSIAQSVDLTFAISEGGKISVDVIDRDGYVVKRLADQKEIKAGSAVFRWNGTDNFNKVVPDEAYTFKIDWNSGLKTESYFPANKQTEQIFLKATYYDQQRHLILYRLTLPSRMHIHAASGKMNAKGDFEGAVLKTLVDREPRAAGAVQEIWDGMDESGTIFVPDLPDFGISIAAEPIPENAVITVGNKTQSFFDYAAERCGQSLLMAQRKGAGHHGLTVLQDISPKLKLNPTGAQWSEKSKSWLANSKSVKVNGVLEGPSTDFFTKYPGELKVFVDGKLIYATKKPVSPFAIDIALESSKNPVAIIFNWDTEYGPVAVGSFRMQHVLQQTAQSSR